MPKPKHGMTAFLLAVISKQRTMKEWANMNTQAVAAHYRIPVEWVEFERRWQMGRV